MSKGPACSIVIRCCNEEKHIGRLLTGIMHQGVEDREVIVVDSGSTDATLAIASRFPVRIVTIEADEFSFGRSLNRGCAAAQGRILVFASAHVYPVYSDWLERLMEPFSDEKVALVYGKQRGNEFTKYSEHQIFKTWFPDHRSSDQPSPFCNNANAAVRRSLWEQHPYDESLTGLEDLHWAKRIRDAGYRIFYEPRAEIVHVHEETAARIYNRYRREAIALKHIFPEQHFNLWDFTRLFAANVVADGFHAFHDGLFLRNLWSIFAFRLMQFWGTYRGFRQHGAPDNRLKKRFYYPADLSRPPERGESREPSTRVEYASYPVEAASDEAH